MYTLTIGNKQYKVEVHNTSSPEYVNPDLNFLAECEELGIRFAGTTEEDAIQSLLVKVRENISISLDYGEDPLVKAARELSDPPVIE